LHVLVPLRRGPSQRDVRAVAQALGRAVAARAPTRATIAMAKADRRGRVFLDALRNAFGQTIAAPYSVRRRPKAPVSMPLAWDEVEPSLDPATFNIRTAERRLLAAAPALDHRRLSGPVARRQPARRDEQLAPGRRPGSPTAGAVIRVRPRLLLYTLVQRNQPHTIRILAVGLSRVFGEFVRGLWARRRRGRRIT
jgi:hypothetical protein